MNRCGFSLPEPEAPQSYLPQLTPEVQRLVFHREQARIRAAADAAWKQRDYAQVIELLSRLEDELAPSEIKKLEICRRKTSE